MLDDNPHVCLGCGVFQDDIDAHRCPTPRRKAEPISPGEQVTAHEYIRQLEAALMEAADGIAGEGYEVEADRYRSMVVVGRCAHDGEAVFLRADVLEVIRRYARPGDTDGDIIARMVWAATRPGGSVAEPISPGR